jgi:hypothetical protein
VQCDNSILFWVLYVAVHHRRRAIGGVAIRVQVLNDMLVCVLVRQQRRWKEEPPRGQEEALRRIHRREGTEHDGDAPRHLKILGRFMERQGDAIQWQRELKEGDDIFTEATKN